MELQKYAVLVEIPEGWSSDDSVENLCRALNRAIELAPGVFSDDFDDPFMVPSVRPLSTEVSC